jgi:hypothetical protein
MNHSRVNPFIGADLSKCSREEGRRETDRLCSGNEAGGRDGIAER